MYKRTHIYIYIHVQTHKCASPPHDPKINYSRTHRKAPIREHSLLLQLLYTNHTEKADSGRMEACLFQIQPLYTNHTEKADSGRMEASPSYVQLYIQVINLP